MEKKKILRIAGRWCLRILLAGFFFGAGWLCCMLFGSMPDYEEDMRRMKEQLQNEQNQVSNVQNAASNGDAQALYDLAIFNLEGYGMNADQERGLQLLQQSADAGWAEAQFAMYNNLATGFFVEQDTKRAESYLQQAFAQDYPGAICEMGIRALEATPADTERGIALLQKAAEAGSADAMLRLSDCYENGIGVLRNSVTAREWADRATQQSEQDDEAKEARMNALAQKG